MDPDLYNFQRLDPLVTTSGRIIAADLDMLIASGTRCIVNLAPDGGPYAMTDEDVETARRGLAYIHIPVAFDSPTEADFALFCAVMEAQAGIPTHVHCIANWRVSAFFYRYRRDVLGWSELTARAPMEAIWQPDPVWAAFLTPRPSYPRAPAT